MLILRCTYWSLHYFTCFHNIKSLISTKISMRQNIGSILTNTSYHHPLCIRRFSFSHLHLICYWHLFTLSITHFHHQSVLDLSLSHNQTWSNISLVLVIPGMPFFSHYTLHYHPFTLITTITHLLHSYLTLFLLKLLYLKLTFLGHVVLNLRRHSTIVMSLLLQRTQGVYWIKWTQHIL